MRSCQGYRVLFESITLLFLQAVKTLSWFECTRFHLDFTFSLELTFFHVFVPPLQHEDKFAQPVCCLLEVRK